MILDYKYGAVSIVAPLPPKPPKSDATRKAG